MPQVSHFRYGRYPLWSDNEHPALGAAQQTLKQMGLESSTPALGCAVAYPMGVVGVILAVLLIRKALVLQRRFGNKRER